MSTALVKYEFAALVNIEETRAAIAENMGDGGMNPAQLDRVKIPSGGGLSWELPSLDGDVETARELQGIIVHWHDVRAYWPMKFSGAGSGPPVCSSADGRVGKGKPGGPCSTCAFSQWESGDNGGQACKQARLLYLLRPDSLLPITITLAPMSLKPSKEYFLRLASKGVLYRHVVTGISLKKAQNKGGITFAQAQFRYLGPVETDMKKAVDAYHKTIAEQAASLAAQAGMVGSHVRAEAADDDPEAY